jgi:hypothetical protein
MSWLYSQALVAEYSAGSCSDGVPCVPSSSTHTQRAYLWRGKTTDAWPRFPSGMTCEPLTDDHGEAVLTWYLAGFPVRTSAPPARVQDSKASDPDYGLRWPASSARFDRDSSSWKIHPCLFPEDSMSCSVTLPRWGTMRDGALSELPTPALRISETGCGYVPTPRKQMARKILDRETYHSNIEEWVGIHYPHLIGQRISPMWACWVMGWPITWTSLAPLATDRFRQWLRSHGDCSPAKNDNDKESK